MAARASRAQLETSESLRGVRVGDVMTPNCPVIDSRSNLQTFVHDHLLRTGHRCFVVEEQGRITGIITPHQLKGFERAKWPYTSVDAVMLPLERLHTVDPHTLVTEALEMMGREDVNQLPVVRDGSVAGIISRGDVLRLLQTRAELQTIRSG
jgi:CBS domain-containing protein